MVRGATLSLGLFGCALLSGCGGGGASTTSTEDEGVGEVESGDTLSEGEAGEVETTGGCPDTQVCGGDCCEDFEACVEGVCELDCDPGLAPCNDVCCGGGEICYVGNCVEPGAPCSTGACATSLASDCEADEVCDLDLGRCVPNLADESCIFEPEVGVFDPVPRFTWGRRAARPCSDGCQKEEQCVAGMCEPTWPHVEIAAGDEPDYYQCVATPMVADLDGDCVPEIVFNTYKDSVYLNDGILRAISGSDGSPVFSLTDPAYRTDPGSAPAIGDITGDGLPEVIVPSDGGTLLAVANDGSVIWESDAHTLGTTKASGSPSLANFDLTGPPEIAYGNAIFDSMGNLLWELTAGASGSNGGPGPLSCVADLNGDDRPELIMGGTVYTCTGTAGVDFTCTELWVGELAEGYCGVADFDGNGTPEVALVRSGSIYIYDGLNGSTLGSIAIPMGGAGGPPNIADFDGDGSPDLGTAGGDRYFVIQYDPTAGVTELWRATTKDGSSQRTGSSVFDFDGDGRAEVIYGDEWYLRIYPGTEPDCPGGPNCDGVMDDTEVLFRDINSSRTRTEYPVIADVDGDFKAEIVISTNNESSQGDIGDAGIEVFEDRLDNWVGTRPIWNQHTYHVSNVAIDGTIPVVEPANWLNPAGNPENSYRRNGQGGLDSLCAPDLVPTDVIVDAMACPDITLSVKILNQGCLGVGPGVAVSLYDDDAGLLGTFFTTGPIPAGGSEQLSMTVPNPMSAPYNVTIVVDDDGAMMGSFNECEEDNNASVPVIVCPPVG